MTIHKVGLCRCPSYEPDRVLEAIEKAIQRAGGGPSLKGEILVKANLLAPAKPEAAVTTHPSVIEGVASWIQKKAPKERVTVSDSPGYVFAGQWPRFVETCGLGRLARDGTCKVVPLHEEGYIEAYRPENRTLKEIRIPAKLARAGTLINLAKCKTHVETEITGCLKNSFGFLDTATRKLAHRSGSIEELCNAVLDSYLSRIPDLNILDAVVGMEGFGPSHGRPRTMGWIVASDNALAVDLVAAFMMGYFDPYRIPLLAAAARRKLGPVNLREIGLAGAKWEELPVRRFKKCSSALRRFVPTPLRGMFHSFVKLSPSWERENCTFCGACSAVCPVNAIHIDQEKLEIDETRCVSCLCCHEMCPTGSMAAKPNFLARLLLRER